MDKKIIYVYYNPIEEYDYFNDFDAIIGFVNDKQESMYKHDNLKDDDKIYVFEKYDDKHKLSKQIKNATIKYRKDFEKVKKLKDKNSKLKIKVKYSDNEPLIRNELVLDEFNCELLDNGSVYFKFCFYFESTIFKFKIGETMHELDYGTFISVYKNYEKLCISTDEVQLNTDADSSYSVIGLKYTECKNGIHKFQQLINDFIEKYENK
jgi:hypothetical protein